jgi:hypothetical protein
MITVLALIILSLARLEHSIEDRLHHNHETKQNCESNKE